jgi:hypothetical protein
MCCIIWFSIPIAGLIWIKSARVNLNIKVILSLALVAVFVLISVWLGNYIDYQINHSLDQYGK